MQIDEKQLNKLNNAVYKNGGIDRSHLLTFLSLIPTNDGDAIVAETKKWLESLHNDPKYTKVNFPDGDITAVLGDLSSYGRVHPDTIAEFRQKPKTVPII